MKTRLMSVLIVALTLASAFAKVRWGYGFFKG
jgi:hypothetical protein